MIDVNWQLTGYVRVCVPHTQPMGNINVAAFEREAMRMLLQAREDGSLKL